MNNPEYDQKQKKYLDFCNSHANCKECILTKEKCKIQFEAGCNTCHNVGKCS